MSCKSSAGEYGNIRYTMSVAIQKAGATQLSLAARRSFSVTAVDDENEISARLFQPCTLQRTQRVHNLRDTLCCHGGQINLTLKLPTRCEQCMN